MILATAKEWARAIGKDPSSIKRALARNGISLEPQEKIAAEKIFQALFGEEAESRRRLMMAEADLKEQKAERQRGELISWTEAEKSISSWVVLPLTQFLNTIPTTYDTRCNPVDPQLARDTLAQLVEDCRKVIRLKIPQPRRQPDRKP